MAERKRSATSPVVIESDVMTRGGGLQSSLCPSQSRLMAAFRISTHR